MRCWPAPNRGRGLTCSPMNYFAHGRQFVDRPYFLVGTAVPDLLNVVNRRVRARRKLAEPFVDDANPHIAALAGGIVRHHEDDDWFHRTKPFTELSLQFTVRIRDWQSEDTSMRPLFLGHILVELLLEFSPDFFTQASFDQPLAKLPNGCVIGNSFRKTQKALEG